MSCGGPQGSVLSSLLWNIGYDWVLRGDDLLNVDVLWYADDILVAARGKRHKEAAILATAVVVHVVNKIRLLGLKVTLNNSESLAFTDPEIYHQQDPILW